VAGTRTFSTSSGGVDASMPKMERASSTVMLALLPVALPTASAVTPALVPSARTHVHIYIYTASAP